MNTASHFSASYLERPEQRGLDTSTCADQRPHDFVVVRAGFAPDDMVLLESDTVTIGRRRDCTVVVDDLSCSRMHCKLRRIDGAWFVFHLSQTNSTRLNGEKIMVGCRQLHDGDVIGVGQTKVFFYEALGEAQQCASTANP